MLRVADLLPAQTNKANWPPSLPPSCWPACLPACLQGATRLPPSFAGNLRPYQLEGFNWLVARYLIGESGILADVSAGNNVPHRLRAMRLMF